MHFHGRVSQSNEQASQTANLHIPACNLRCFVVVCISRNAVFHFKKSCIFALQMIIYCNYTTICRKVQACTFFLWWKKFFRDTIPVIEFHFLEFPIFFVKRELFFTCQYRPQNIIFMLRPLTFLKKET